MKIYFASNRPKTIKSHLAINNWLKQEKHQVKKELLTKDSKPVKLKNFEMVILEVEKSGKLVYKIIFEALMLKKPVLLLYDYHSRRPKKPKFQLMDKKILKSLTIKGYVLNQLPQILEKFFFDLAKGPAGRFNLFISRDMEDYLNWIPYSLGKTKSDFIRGLVREEMKQDKKYNARKNKKLKIIL